MDLTRRKTLIDGAGWGALALAGLLPASCAKEGGRKDRPSERDWPPKRPPGVPKPMVQEDIAPVLARLDAWYAAHLPADRCRLNPPASEVALAAFQRQAGVRLPRAWHTLYRWHDGENDDRFGHIFGLPLLPIREVEAQWTAWKDVLGGFHGDRYKVRGGAWPAGAVDPAYINPRWIPLTHDGSGNHIGLDFDPWPKGRIGQVILFGRDEDVKAVVAQSLGGFLERVATLLETGNYRLRTTPGEAALRSFELKRPPTDDFMDGLREIIGAPGPFV